MCAERVIKREREAEWQEEGKRNPSILPSTTKTFSNSPSGIISQKQHSCVVRSGFRTMQSGTLISVNDDFLMEQLHYCWNIKITELLQAKIQSWKFRMKVMRGRSLVNWSSKFDVTIGVSPVQAQSKNHLSSFLGAGIDKLFSTPILRGLTNSSFYMLQQETHFSADFFYDRCEFLINCLLRFAVRRKQHRVKKKTPKNQKRNVRSCPCKKA